jgi:hypothetical protein
LNGRHGYSSTGANSSIRNVAKEMDHFICAGSRDRGVGSGK